MYKYEYRHDKKRSSKVITDKQFYGLNIVERIPTQDVQERFVVEDNEHNLWMTGHVKTGIKLYPLYKISS